MVERVQLGNTDLYVNPIGYGANFVGGHNLYKNITDESGKEVVRSALQNGLNFIDTAYSYGKGRSEELIGEVVREMGNRQEIVIATKGSHRYEGNQTIHDNSPTYLKESVENSLKRLNTDYIDLYYIHWPDETTPKYEAVGALKELKDQGKIRAIGVSNFSLEQLKEANQDGYVDVYQGEYNLFNRQAEKELFPYLLEHQISFVPYYPLAAGILAGKYTKDMKFDDLRARLPFFQKDTFEKNLDRVEILKEIARDKNIEVANLVLAWYLTRDPIDAIIPGAKKPEQILNNLKTLDVKLTEEEIKLIDENFPTK